MQYQGYFSSSQVVADAATADRIVGNLASQNQPILNVYGEPIKAGGSDLIAFSATQEQRANSYLLNTPTAEAERQQMANQRQTTLAYLGAINGGAPRDYIVEETLLGGAIGGRVIEAVGAVVRRGSSVLGNGAKTPLRPGALPDDAAILNNFYRDADGFAQAAQRDFAPGTTARAENINAGQVVDRDGLPRVDKAKALNEEQIKEMIGLKQPSYWGTSYPAWKEGTVVTDRVVTKSETYRMVIDEKQYEAIKSAVRDGDMDVASKQLGGWATKDPINSLADVRNNLAIVDGFKSTANGGKLYAVEFTVKPGVGIREGTVGPMWDPSVSRFLPGGGNQVNFMVGRPSATPDLFQIDPTSIKGLH